MGSIESEQNDPPGTGGKVKDWNFFSKHAHLLFLLALNPTTRVADLASQLELTDRTVRSLLRTLEKAGVVSCERVGRNNCYSIDYSVELTHLLEKEFLYESVVSDVVESRKSAIASEDS